MEKNLERQNDREALLYGTITAATLTLDVMLEGKYGDLAKSHAHDILLPIIISTMYTSVVKGCFFDKSTPNAGYYMSVFAFLGCSALEIAQKLHLYSGWYNPKDFIAYGVGALTAAGISNLISRKRKQSTPTKSLDTLVA